MTLEDVLRDPELIPYARRWLFEQLTAGLISAGQASDVARRIGVELEAGSYAVALFDLPPAGREGGPFSDPAAAARENLYAYFLKYSEYMPVQLGPALGAVLIKGEPDRLADLTERCVRRVREQYDAGGVKDWYLAVSSPAARLEDLPERFREASRLRALRVVRPGEHVFRPGAEPPPLSGYGDLPPETDLLRTDPALLLAFLENGRREDVPGFVRGYLGELGGAMGSRSFRDYVLLSARCAAERFAAGLGLPRERYIRVLGPRAELYGEPERLLGETLSATMGLRDLVSGGAPGGTLGDAVGYVNGHFTDPELTLARTAAHAGVTASYLSGLFSRALGCTFTKYVTARRMELARRLLRTTDRRSGQIARDVGFRDSHYFNALFKKTQGCTPAQFRAGGADGEGPDGV